MSSIKTKEAYALRLGDLKEATGIKNTMDLPRIDKVSVNVGLGRVRLDKDRVEYISQSLALITGQKAFPTKAKRAVVGFKIRENDIIGYRVTLRDAKMNDFIDRLLNISLPRIREFRGIDPKKFDGQGNLTIGLRDQISFAELGSDAIDRLFGMTITLTIKNSDPKKSLDLLKTLGFPMKTK